ECGRHGLIDDLEVPAAGELLELDEGEIGLDAGRVAVHDEADGAGRGDDGHLGVAEPVLDAEFEHAVGLGPGAGEERRRASPRIAYPRPSVRKSYDFRATGTLGNWAMCTLISRISVQMRTACL